MDGPRIVSDEYLQRRDLCIADSNDTDLTKQPLADQNGQQCGFLDLPKPIRQTIYHHTFTSFSPRLNLRSAKYRNAGILLACRQTHDEAIELYYRSSIFFCCGSKIAVEFLAGWYRELVTCVRVKNPTLDFLKAGFMLREMEKEMEEKGVKVELGVVQTQVRLEGGEVVWVGEIPAEKKRVPSGMEELFIPADVFENGKTNGMEELFIPEDVFEEEKKLMGDLFAPHGQPLDDWQGEHKNLFDIGDALAKRARRDSGIFLSRQPVRKALGEVKKYNGQELKRIGRGMKRKGEVLESEGKRVKRDSVAMELLEEFVGGDLWEGE